jgi:hypothetical protein
MSSLFTQLACRVLKLEPQKDLEGVFAHLGQPLHISSFFTLPSLDARRQKRVLGEAWCAGRDVYRHRLLLSLADGVELDLDADRQR